MDAARLVDLPAKPLASVVTRALGASDVAWETPKAVKDVFGYIVSASQNHAVLFGRAVATTERGGIVPTGDIINALTGIALTDSSADARIAFRDAAHAGYVRAEDAIVTLAAYTDDEDSEFAADLLRAAKQVLTRLRARNFPAPDVSHTGVAAIVFSWGHRPYSKCQDCHWS
jgi:hypothetical protein